MNQECYFTSLTWQDALARLRRHRTNREIATAIGFHQARVIAWAHGQAEPTLKAQGALIRLARELPADVRPKAMIEFLGAIEAHPGCTVSQAADALGRTPQALSMLVATATKNGLVARTRLGAAYSYGLTPRGRRKLLNQPMTAEQVAAECASAMPGEWKPYKNKAAAMLHWPSGSIMVVEMDFALKAQAWIFNGEQSLSLPWTALRSTAQEALAEARAQIWRALGPLGPEVAR